jgi:hypothetical protein
MRKHYEKFDDLAIREIGLYVYALRDPRDGVVFYVGKGQRNRWFDHIHEAQSLINNPSLKLNRIREIEESGHYVEAYIIRSGIPTEKMAYEIEAAVIHGFQLLKKSENVTAVELTNIAEVHHPERGLVHVSIAQTMFNAPPAPEITVPCGLFRIPRLWYPEMTDEELRQATLGWWSARNVRKPMKVAQYAFAVSRGVIRGVYSINEKMWRERQPGDRDYEHDRGQTPRWGFPDCTPATEMSHYLNTSVKHFFKKGDANPVRFLNCSE